MWTMPITQAFKLVALCYISNTGEEVRTHEEREVIRRQQEVFKKVSNG